ncbi:class I adenylate-forming enzyme family protein [Amorphus sp. 3PC139-8]|uniref:class I adenylate-forming enzyme family protein n=1 Tax=Amorphus sp. 3PC139-8 TaxID=2735676 RepID=UPI00345D0CB8
MVSKDHLAQVFAELADRYGDRSAVRDAKDTLSYAVFFERVFRFGSGLKTLGLAPGDKVGLLLPDVRAYLEADYGVMAAGLVRVPLDPRMAPVEKVAQLVSAGAKAVVTTADHTGDLDAIRAALPDIRVVLAAGALPDATPMETVIAAGDPEPWDGGCPDDLAALNFSGGTTGRPKATMIRQRNLAAVMAATSVGFAISPDDVFLNIRPLWPIAQVIVMSHFAAGAEVVLGGRFDPARFADLFAETGATRTSMVPTQLVRVLDHIRKDDPRLARLTAVHVGGSRLPPATFARALDLIGPRIGVLYGLTEAPITTYLSPADFAAAPNTAARKHLMRASGRVLADYEIRLGEGGGPASDGLGPSGEVTIRGDNVMAGYWQEPELTEAALRDGWLHTGDLGAFDAEGRLTITGRLKEVIRSGASSILPKEVEDAIAQQPGVSEVAVVGLPDEEWGEIVAAFVVASEGAELSPRALIDGCDEGLARFKRPKRVFVVDEIPRSHYGKVLRPQLLSKLDQLTEDQTRNQR